MAGLAKLPVLDRVLTEISSRDSNDFEYSPQLQKKFWELAQGYLDGVDAPTTHQTQEALTEVKAYVQVEIDSHLKELDSVVIDPDLIQKEELVINAPKPKIVEKKEAAGGAAKATKKPASVAAPSTVAPEPTPTPTNQPRKSRKGSGQEVDVELRKAYASAYDAVRKVVGGQAMFEAYNESLATRGHDELSRPESLRAARQRLISQNSCPPAFQAIAEDTAGDQNFLQKLEEKLGAELPPDERKAFVDACQSVAAVGTPMPQSLGGSGNSVPPETMLPREGGVKKG